MHRCLLPAAMIGLMIGPTADRIWLDSTGYPSCQAGQQRQTLLAWIWSGGTGQWTQPHLNSTSRVRAHTTKPGGPLDTPHYGQHTGARPLVPDRPGWG
jgi:hypothetical protein